MNNKDNFKKAIDNIHAPEDLKDRIFQKIKNKPKNNLIYMKILSVCALFTIVFGLSIYFTGNSNNFEFAKNNINEENNLPRFKDIEELKNVLAKNSSRSSGFLTKGLDYESSIAVTDSASNSESSNREQSTSENDYSTTNVQVEGVDEADIVKTDGKNIYYVKNNMVYIVDSENLKVINKLSFDEDDNDFVPKEIFIKDNQMVVLGSSYIFDDSIEENEDKCLYDRYKENIVTEAIVLDISKIEKPKEERRVAIDGIYNNSRMIGDNLYFISNKSVYYYEDVVDDDILPIYKDSVKANEVVRIPAEDIAYFGGTRNYSYMLVAGFNINSKTEASVETIFGASNTVYANDKNLYIVQEKYSTNGNIKSIIYKFGLNDSKIVLKAKGSVKGYLKDQFAMDEFDENLRIATTSNVDNITKNQIYILDKNLEKIGSLKNMAIDEKIYSVRFIGKIGYVVTFKQIDPLFVIDLSDPTNPEIKCELKIPGYSSYLHPYDETHVIGIGYNTKENGYGGIINTNMKMSMFDVSDLENPKEIFNVDIGDEYSYSEITSNHKALFYNKVKNLIGFPITYRTKNYSDSKSGFIIYKIDLDKGFEKYGDLTDKISFSNSPERVIYIKDTLYTIFQNEIDSYDLNTLNKKNELLLK